MYVHVCNVMYYGCLSLLLCLSRLKRDILGLRQLKEHVTLRLTLPRLLAQHERWLPRVTVDPSDAEAFGEMVVLAEEEWLPLILFFR